MRKAKGKSIMTKKASNEGDLTILPSQKRRCLLTGDLTDSQVQSSFKDKPVIRQHAYIIAGVAVGTARDILLA